MDEKERDELLISIGKSLVTLARTHVLLLDMVKALYRGEPMPDPDTYEEELVTEFKKEMTEAEPEVLQDTAEGIAGTKREFPTDGPPQRMHFWRKHESGSTTCMYCGVEYGMQESAYCPVKEGTQPHES